MTFTPRQQELIRLLRRTHDTTDIARIVKASEADVYNFIAVLSGTRQAA